MASMHIIDASNDEHEHDIKITAVICSAVLRVVMSACLRDIKIIL